MKKFITKFIVFILIFMHTPTSIYAYDYTGHWAENVINKWFNNGKIEGVGNGDFAPEDFVTRAEFISMLVRDLNLSAIISGKNIEFTDVSKTDWFYSYILSASQNNIITGVADNQFAPNNYILRQDAATILCRAYKIEYVKSFDVTKYNDGIYISDYALEYMSYMCEKNVLTGYTDSTIKPLNNLTRAEAIILIDRMREMHPVVNDVEDIKFASGYPKLNDSGLSAGFNVSIKTNKPCTIYYSLVDVNSSAVVPNKKNVSNYLIKIENAQEIVSAYIPADTKSKYNIFFKAVDSLGNESRVVWISQAKALFFTEGDGSKNNPYLISTEEQLSAIRFFLDKHYKLKNDIILSNKWIPIGAADTQNEMFTGSLDGSGCKISNLSITQRESHAGLFACVYEANIKNLYVSSQKITGNDYVGIIAGESINSTIENCFTDGLVQSYGNYAGAIVGSNSGIISRCQSAALAVEAQSFAGGIAGANSGTIEESMSCTYSVSANMYSSGIAGENLGGTIKNCIAANMAVTDTMTKNNGRITTNKSGGVTENNYGYNKMYATVGDGVPDKNHQNGLDITWDDLCDISIYTDILNWDFNASWRFADETDLFRLPSLNSLSKPIIKEGVTIYAPKKISTAEQLQQINEAPDNHYILTNDISLPSLGEGISNWQAICDDNNLIENPNSGFSGSLDGNGYSILNMNIEYAENAPFYGLFGVISSGTVKNLTLKNYTLSSSETTGAIAAINYGTISNCYTDGKIQSDQTKALTLTGGIAGINYGTIENCETYVNIVSNGNSTTTGGICANNEGVVFMCASKGTITSNGRNLASESTNGGIVGFNSDGLIYSSYASPQISTKTHTVYAGGIVGMLNGGEVYQVSSSGAINVNKINSKNTISYVGGISGLSGFGTIIHSFSYTKLNVSSVRAYTGGISGYNLSSNIQNTYSANEIKHTAVSNSLIGGIAAVNEDGFISENVCIIPQLPSIGRVARICAKSTGGEIYNNYAYSQMKESGQIFDDSDLNGIGINLTELKKSSFFFSPITSGGALGWSSGYEGAWIWGSTINPYYHMPLLNGVKYQDTFNMPNY